jgi:hypothetical protein
MVDTDANVLVGRAWLTIDGVDCGHLKDGVTTRMSREYYDVEGQHRVGVIKKVKTSERMFIATTAQEATLRNIKSLWDQGTGTVSGTRLNLGSPNQYEHTLVIRGSGPNGATRVITIHRAVSINEGAIPMDKGAESAIPIEFECLKDTSNLDSNSEPLFGHIIDIPSS